MSVIEILDFPLGHLSDALSPLNDAIVEILATLISLLAACKIAILIQQYRASQVAIGKDILLRALWYSMIGVMSWLPVYFDSKLGDPAWGWYFDRQPFAGMDFGYIGFGYISAVLATLIMRSCFATHRLERTHYRSARMAIMVGAGVAIMVVLLQEVTVLPGLITVALLSIEIREPHVFRGFRMDPCGTDIHTNTGALLNVVWLGLLLLFLHFCFLAWSGRHRSRYSFGLMLLTLIGAASVAWYADACVAVRLSENIAPLHFTTDWRRIMAIVITSLPLTLPTAWYVVSRNCVQIDTRETSPERGVHLFELTLIALLGLAFFLNFSFCLITPYPWIDGGVFFFHAMPVFACAFACGRRIDMRWSRHLCDPTVYYIDFPITATIGWSTIIALQLFTSAVLICWLAMIGFWLPLP